MESTIILLGILGLIYHFYYEQIYKRTSGYKKKQIIDLEREGKQLLANNATVLEETQSFLDKNLTQEEQAKFMKELDKKDKREISEMLNKLWQPIESNSTDKAAAQRGLIGFHHFERVKLKFVRLMERLKYRSTDERLQATQDWIDYMRIFFNQENANRPHLMFVALEEIEKRFDSKLEDSGK